MLFSAVVSRYTRAAATLDMSAAYVQQSMDSGPCLRQGLVFRTTAGRQLAACVPTPSLWLLLSGPGSGVCAALLGPLYGRVQQLHLNMLKHTPDQPWRTAMQCSVDVSLASAAVGICCALASQFYHWQLVEFKFAA
jgi:hypothetical protein